MKFIVELHLPRRKKKERGIGVKRINSFGRAVDRIRKGDLVGFDTGRPISVHALGVALDSVLPGHFVRVQIQGGPADNRVWDPAARQGRLEPGTENWFVRGTVPSIQADALQHGMEASVKMGEGSGESSAPGPEPVPTIEGKKEEEAVLAGMLVEAEKAGAMIPVPNGVRWANMSTMWTTTIR